MIKDGELNAETSFFNSVRLILGNHVVFPAFRVKEDEAFRRLKENLIEVSLKCIKYHQT